MRHLVPLLALTLVAADWPVFRGDAAMSGVSPEALPAELTEKWEFKCKDSVECAPAVVGDAVFVASMDRHLYRLDAATGKEVWRAKLGPMKSSPAAASGRIFVGDAEGKVYAVDAATGKVAWTAETGGEITSGANFGGGAVLVGSHGGSLWAFDPASGKVKWEYKVGEPINGSPAVRDGRAYVAGCDSVLHAVDLATGKVVGTPVDIGGQAGATAALGEGGAYVGTMANQLVAVDLGGAKKAWEFEPKRRGQPFYASAAVAGKLVVTGSRDRKVYALDRATGQEVWNFATEGAVDASPVVSGGRVYVGALSSTGEFYVLDLATGKQLQQLTLDSAASGSPAVSGGRLFVGTEKGTVYCFGAK